MSRRGGARKGVVLTRIALVPDGYVRRDGRPVRCQMMWNVKLMTTVGTSKRLYATVGSVDGKRPANVDAAQIEIVNLESFVTTSKTQKSQNVIKTFAEVTVTATSERTVF